LVEWHLGWPNSTHDDRGPRLGAEPEFQRAHKGSAGAKLTPSANEAGAVIPSAVNSTLVLVDMQARLMPAIQEGNAVIERCLLLARAARALGVPMLGTEQNPPGLGATVAPLASLLDRRIAKLHFDASRENLFLDSIEPARRCLVVGGCEAHVCVLQTALGLRSHGFEVSVVADAVGSRRTIDRQVALTRLQCEGIQIMTAEMVVFEWLERSDHPKFRELLAWIR
jgi:nicotinamidase-related amidase